MTNNNEDVQPNTPPPPPPPQKEKIEIVPEVVEPVDLPTQTGPPATPTPVDPLPKPSPPPVEEEKEEPVDLPTQTGPLATALPPLVEPIGEQTEQTVEEVKPVAEPPAETEKIKPVDLPTQTSPPPPPPASTPPPPTPPPPPPSPAVQSPDSFPTRFKARLKELLSMANIKRKQQADEHIQKIMDYAYEHNRIDNKTARELTKLSDDRARYYLDKLEKEKKLIQFGKKGPKVFYKPLK